MVAVIVFTLVVGNAVLGKYVVQAKGYDYQWLEGKPTAVELSDWLGVEVSKVTYGSVVTGYETINIMGMEIEQPVVEPGIEIEFLEQPSSEQLDKLDLLFSLGNFKRDSGITIVDKLNELEDSINQLEK